MAQQSRYLKPQRELKIFQAVAVLFFFTLYVLPQYFGLPFPLFDLTALRIMIVAVLLLMLAEPERIRGFMLLVMLFFLIFVLVIIFLFNLVKADMMFNLSIMMDCKLENIKVFAFLLRLVIIVRL